MYYQIRLWIRAQFSIRYQRCCKCKTHFWKQWPLFRSFIYASARVRRIIRIGAPTSLRPPLGMAPKILVCEPQVGNNWVRSFRLHPINLSRKAVFWWKLTFLLTVMSAEMRVFKLFVGFILTCVCSLDRSIFIAKSTA